MERPFASQIARVLSNIRLRVHPRGDGADVGHRLFGWPKPKHIVPPDPFVLKEICQYSMSGESRILSISGVGVRFVNTAIMSGESSISGFGPGGLGSDNYNVHVATGSFRCWPMLG